MDVSGTYIEPATFAGILVETEFPDTACTAMMFEVEATECNVYSSLGFTFLEVVIDTGLGGGPETFLFLAPPAGNQTPIGLGLISINGERPPSYGAPWLFFWPFESTGTEADG